MGLLVQHHAVRVVAAMRWLLVLRRGRLGYYTARIYRPIQYFIDVALLLLQLLLICIDFRVHANLSLS